MDFFVSLTNAFATDLLGVSTQIAFVALIMSFLLTVVRLVRGPSVADRVVALDSLFILGMAFIAVYVIATGRDVYLDIAIALGLVGFLATVAYARFVFQRWRTREYGSDD
jgi:multicomponent Na+:H+ antiporter subunit F